MLQIIIFQFGATSQTWPTTMGKYSYVNPANVQASLILLHHMTFKSLVKLMITVYDLRKASFSGTVSDKDCDDAFNQLMKANCNDRSFINRQLCNATRATVYRAVRLGPVVTDPNPGVVVISNIASKK